ncbi:MAG: hypothetical protein KGL39_51055 [Patescibacteria group bacterium]|nr:hypothetical protein [Patescibacteria group bacterium]
MSLLPELTEQVLQEHAACSQAFAKTEAWYREHNIKPTLRSRFQDGWIKAMGYVAVHGLPADYSDAVGAPTYEELSADPSTPYWLRSLLHEVEGKDAVDVANAAEVFAKAASARARAAFHA